MITAVPSATQFEIRGEAYSYAMRQLLRLLSLMGVEPGRNANTAVTKTPVAINCRHGAARNALLLAATAGDKAVVIEPEKAYADPYGSDIHITPDGAYTTTCKLARLEAYLVAAVPPSTLQE